MTNAKLTDVTVLIDKSPSMLELVDDTIAGFNAFLDKQRQIVKTTGSHCDLQVIQFDDHDEPGLRTPVQSHPPLDRKSYAPRGVPGNQTALLDSLGRAIDETGKRYAAMPEGNRPGKVLFVVITDGSDNASMRFSPEDIREKISLQHSAYHWDFIYLGANQDAFVVGSHYGFRAGKTLSTAATGPGTRAGFEAAANYVANTLQAPDGETASEHMFSEEDVRRARRASNKGAEARA